MLLNHCVMTVFSLKKRMNEWMNEVQPHPVSYPVSYPVYLPQRSHRYHHQSLYCSTQPAWRWMYSLTTHTWRKARPLQWFIFQAFCFISYRSVTCKSPQWFGYLLSTKNSIHAVGLDARFIVCFCYCYRHHSLSVRWHYTRCHLNVLQWFSRTVHVRRYWPSGVIDFEHCVRANCSQ